MYTTFVLLMSISLPFSSRRTSRISIFEVPSNIIEDYIIIFQLYHTKLMENPFKQDVEQYHPAFLLHSLFNFNETWLVLPLRWFHVSLILTWLKIISKSTKETNTSLSWSKRFWTSIRSRNVAFCHTVVECELLLYRHLFASIVDSILSTS